MPKLDEEPRLKRQKLSSTPSSAADNDTEGDSTMHSSPAAATPSANMATADEDDLFPGATSQPAFLSSPPPSQSLHHSQLPGVSVSTDANADAKGKAPQRLHKDPVSGYSWTRPEDAPGWAWRNDKAQAEMKRATEWVMDWQSIVGLRYGDIGLDAAAAAEYAAAMAAARQVVEGEGEREL